MSSRRHRVIVPVHIPGVTGYFRHAQAILDMSLDSLRATVGPDTVVSVVLDGCAPDIVDQVLERNGSWLDHVTINRVNRGKVDSVAAVARASSEELVTIADADVLFLRGWLEATLQLFVTFPECGFVSPSPNPALSWALTSSTVLGAFTRRELGLRSVVPVEDLDRFARSVGRPEWFRPEHRASQLVVERRDLVACVGGGHFVFTIRRDVLSAMPVRPLLMALGGSLERQWLDQPVDRLGFWKLSTSRAYAHHMGNVPEPWMLETVQSMRDVPPGAAADGFTELPPMRPAPLRRVPWPLRLRLARALRMAYARRAAMTLRPVRVAIASREVEN